MMLMKAKKKYKPDDEAHFTLGLIRGRWKLYILLELRSGPLRTGQLVRMLEGIAKNSLNENLRELARAGLIRRKAFAGRVPRVEYGLTPLGVSLCPVVAALNEWGARNKSKVQRIKSSRRGAD
jgi:DNA-binding HxlR family transcriptional regulator